MKLINRRFRMGKRRYFFTPCVIRLWKSLSQYVWMVIKEDWKNLWMTNLPMTFMYYIYVLSPGSAAVSLWTPVAEKFQNVQMVAMAGSTFYAALTGTPATPFSWKKLLQLPIPCNHLGIHAVLICVITVDFLWVWLNWSILNPGPRLIGYIFFFFPFSFGKKFAYQLSEVVLSIQKLNKVWNFYMKNVNTWGRVWKINFVALWLYPFSVRVF